MMIRAVVAIALVILVAYGIIKAYPLLKGPELAIESPLSGTTSPLGFVLVSGVARHTESLELNGGPLLIDEQGRFMKELLLPQGVGILSLTARDRFGRTVTEKRTVYVP